ncbi:MAG: ABC transporter substrate-binding protein [Bacillota bacterium]
MKNKWSSKQIAIVSAVAVLIFIFGIGLFSTKYTELTEAPMGEADGKAGITAITTGDQEVARAIPNDGIFTMITRSMGSNINPIFASREGEKLVVDIVFEPLARRDKDGVMQPILAKEITYSEDRKTITVKIDTEILFSDGTPINVQDVELSLLLALLTDTVGTHYVAGRVDLLAGNTASLSGIQSIDQETIQITFSDYDIRNEQILEIPIQKGQSFDFSASDLEAYTNELLGIGIGTNAYCVVHNTATEVYLVPNEHYREEILSIDDIRVFDQNIVDVEAMLADQVIDYIYFEAQNTMLNIFLEDERYAVYGKETDTVLGLVVNDSSVPMKNYYIRQAIYEGIDRQELLPTQHWYRYKPTSSVITGHGYLSAVEQLEGDITAAKADFNKGINGLGMEEFYLTLPIIQGNALYETVGEGVEKELSDVGFHVTVKPRSTEAYIDSLYLTNDYDLYLDEVVVPATKEGYETFAIEYFTTFPTTFDQVWEDIAKAVTEEEKIAAYEAAENMMQEHSTFIPVARSQNFIGIAASWEGFSITPYTDAPEDLHKTIYE